MNTIKLDVNGQGMDYNETVELIQKFREFLTNEDLLEYVIKHEDEDESYYVKFSAEYHNPSNHPALLNEEWNKIEIQKLSNQRNKLNREIAKLKKEEDEVRNDTSPKELVKMELEKEKDKLNRKITTLKNTKKANEDS